MASVLDKQIVDFLPLLGNEEKKNILGFIKSFIKIKETTNRISIEQYNKELNEAMARIDAGKYLTQEEVEKESKAW
ncbi:hypothetical protein EMGBS15_12930 [Filimonas sp.]|jgi:hypothetical protein|nr:hypothetical protein EMGBS15_12930 [Filimonas sp.]